MNTPTLNGPVPGPIGLITTSFDLDAVGYVAEEHFVSGTAQSYTVVGEAGDDGRWTVEPGPTAPYTTRIVVNRPVDPARFNGTVVVEWLNVSAGTDVAAEWMMIHRHLLREGFVWIGLSAQSEGIDGTGPFVDGMAASGNEAGLGLAPPLKQTDPERYGDLSHPGDAYAFDLFTQVGRLARRIVPDVTRVLGVGESQSASYLVTYVNAIAPVEPAFDGYLIHGRPGNPAGIEGWDARDLDGTVRVRTDGTAPVLILQSETDVVGALRSLRSRQPDAERLRLWEVAGAAHADTYTVGASFSDDGSLRAEELAASLAPADFFGTGTPINSGPQQHYVAQTALAALDRWVRTGEAPPSAPLLETDGSDLVLDAAGNARGGLRTPWVDVPIAVLSGLGASTGMGVLFGSTGPLDLATRYPGGRAEYIDAFRRAAQECRFLLPEDLDEIIAVAEASFPKD